MNKDKEYKRVGRIYKTVDKDKGNEERILKHQMKTKKRKKSSIKEEKKMEQMEKGFVI